MTDKLARIEERAVASGFTAVYPPADVLALVNIAKAAQDVLDYENAPSRSSLSALRAALAVLDGDQ